MSIYSYAPRAPEFETLVDQAITVFYHEQSPITLSAYVRGEFIDAVGDTIAMINAVRGELTTSDWAAQLDLTHNVPDTTGRDTTEDGWARVVELLVEAWHDDHVVYQRHRTERAATPGAAWDANQELIVALLKSIDASQARMLDAMERMAARFERGLDQ